MIIKQITVLKAVSNLKGEPFNVMLTADVKEEESIAIGILKLSQMIDSKIACLNAEHVDSRAVKRDAQPSKEQWFRLRQLIVRKKGMKDDDEMLEYVKVRIGTDNLDWVSSEEVENLINEMEKEC
ncbi:MAG: hypothetical protein JW803_04245 [Endomicrobiales bacterium]|nr:hypothetical protein [Endomicrobiales bacterium]